MPGLGEGAQLLNSVSGWRRWKRSGRGWWCRLHGRVNASNLKTVKMVNSTSCMFYEIQVFFAVCTVVTPLSSWAHTVFAAQPSPPHPPGLTATGAFCPKGRGRTHLGTELASLVGVASFPKTSSMMRSSGVAVTGSSGGTSVMISATCSVWK